MGTFTLGNVTIGATTYPNTHLELFPHDRLVEVDLGNDDGPIATISITNPHHNTPTAPLFPAKDHSENTGVVDELVRLGVAERTGVIRPFSEFAALVEMRLIGEYAAAAKAVAA